MPLQVKEVIKIDDFSKKNESMARRILKKSKVLVRTEVDSSSICLELSSPATIRLIGADYTGLQ